MVYTKPKLLNFIQALHQCVAIQCKNLPTDGTCRFPNTGTLYNSKSSKMSQGQNNIFAFKIPDFKYGLKFSSEILENYTSSSYLNLDFIRQFSCHVVKLVSCRIKDLHNNFQACSSLYSAINIHCKVVFRRKLKRSLEQKKAIKVLLMESWYGYNIGRATPNTDNGSLILSKWKQQYFLNSHYMAVSFPKIHIHTSMHTHTCYLVVSCLYVQSIPLCDRPVEC